MKLNELYKKYSVNDVYDLHRLHLEADQKAVKSGIFNPKNNNLLVNKISKDLQEVNLRIIKNENTKKAIKDMLWLWYHHSTTFAIWYDHDLRRAKVLCDKALTYLYDGHPNRITYMIFLLLHHRDDDAIKWMKYNVNENEVEYAKYLISEYNKGTFL